MSRSLRWSMDPAEGVCGRGSDAANASREDLVLGAQRGLNVDGKRHDVFSWNGYSSLQDVCDTGCTLSFDGGPHFACTALLVFLTRVERCREVAARTVEGIDQTQSLHRHFVVGIDKCRHDAVGLMMVHEPLNVGCLIRCGRCQILVVALDMTFPLATVDNMATRGTGRK